METSVDMSEVVWGHLALSVEIHMTGLGGEWAIWTWSRKLIPTVSSPGFLLHREVRMGNKMAPTVRSNPSLGQIWWVDTGLLA